jgi:TatD DNase family protein
MITDTHCHLASQRFDSNEVQELISRAKDAGVHRMVTLATSLDDAPRNLDLASTEGVFTALGIHPCDVHNAPDDAIEKLSVYISDDRVCAIGETGLDYFHPAPEGWSEEKYRVRQKHFLRRHFEMAAANGLNIVIHTRDLEGAGSFVDAIEVYRDYSDCVRAVFHCFVSPWEQAEKVLDLGGLVSFGGVTTFKKSEMIRDVVRRCPAGSFMVETDSPYLAPEPMRGKRNEPAFASRIAKVIAEIRGESLEELAAHTETTANQFFRW